MAGARTPRSSRLERIPAGEAAIAPAEPRNDAERGARTPLDDDPARVAEFEGYIREARCERRSSRCSPATSRERPRSSWGWYALGYVLFAQQKIGEAIRALAKSLQLDITNAEAHKILGRSLMIIGRFDAAQLEFEQAIRYKPDSAEIHYNLGHLFSMQDNWAPARKALRGGPAPRPLLRRGAGRAGVRARGAGRRRGRGREVRSRRSPSTRRGRATSPPPT